MTCHLVHKLSIDAVTASTHVLNTNKAIILIRCRAHKNWDMTGIKKENKLRQPVRVPMQLKAKKNALV
jgi:hypothetical protein